MGLLSKFKFGIKSAWTPGEFWTWFQSAEGQRVLNATGQPGKDSEVAEIGRALGRVNRDLTWGLRPRNDDMPSAVFEVGAGGLRGAIPAVRLLVDAAPAIAGWSIVAFKQPMSDFTIRLGPDIDSKTVMVASTPRPDGLFDLAVYVPTPAGCPLKTTGELGYIFLDHVLGEYAVMTRLNRLTFESTLVAPPGVISLAAFATQLEN